MNKRERVERLKLAFRYGVLGIVLSIAVVVFVGLFLSACAADNPRITRSDPGTYVTGMRRPFGELHLSLTDGLFTASTPDGADAFVVLPRGMTNSDGSPSAFALGEDD